MLREVSTEKNKKVLLHACCAPCAAPSVVRLLEEDLKPTLFYSNPNIYPESEWFKRLESLERLSEAYKLPLVVEPWDHKSWLAVIKGNETEPEGGGRCRLCFKRALEASSKKAVQEGYDFFTTTLTLSPLKNARLIFDLAKELPGFLPRDFKKREGVKLSVALSKELDLYRQNYCGCEFSLPAARSNPS